jgi:transcriptional regulator with XRE-family HTH domain
MQAVVRATNRYRAAAGLTATDLARRIGCNPARLSAVLTGVRHCTRPLAQALQAVLDAQPPPAAHPAPDEAPAACHEPLAALVAARAALLGLVDDREIATHAGVRVVDVAEALAGAEHEGLRAWASVAPTIDPLLARAIGA